MNHISFASAIPFAIAMIILLFRRRAGLLWLILTPLFMGLCSLWAVAPDLPRLWGNKELYLKLSFEPRCNIFFFHHYIDGTESDSPWWGAVVAISAGIMLFIACWELKITEGEN